MEFASPRIGEQTRLHLWVFHDARGPFTHRTAGLVV